MLNLPPKNFDKKFQLTIWSGKVFYSQKFYGIFLCLVLKKYFHFRLEFKHSDNFKMFFFFELTLDLFLKALSLLIKIFFVLSQAEGGIYF